MGATFRFTLSRLNETRPRIRGYNFVVFRPPPDTESREGSPGPSLAPDPEQKAIVGFRGFSERQGIRVISDKLASKRM